MSNKKVLIVEDDADVRLGYQILLKVHHYDTFFAGDGVSAIAEARKRESDLIVLDLGLPAGDGFIVLERLRAITFLSVIPVIVVSARDPRGHKDRAPRRAPRPARARFSAFHIADLTHTSTACSRWSSTSGTAMPGWSWPSMLRRWSPVACGVWCTTM